ncbi:MAG TPA: helix-turn-helix transcriptional regulator [Jiangellaceae bacterium]
MRKLYVVSGHGTVKPNGKALKRRRVAAGLTQEDVVARAGVSRGTLTRLEASERVYAKTLHKVVAAIEAAERGELKPLDVLAGLVDQLTDLDARLRGIEDGGSEEDRGTQGAARRDAPRDRSAGTGGG